MIMRLVSEPSGFGLEAELPRGAVAYIDGDWLWSAPSAEVPALVLHPAGADPNTRAAQALARVARESVAHVLAEGRSGVVDVTGAGLVATIARLLLGERLSAHGPEAPRPDAVIESTGDPRRIDAAIRGVADLGLVVLAGESIGRRLDLDLYPDVHVRGLELLGVAAAHVSDLQDEAEPLPVPVPAPTEIPVGSQVPPSAVWYRVTGPAGN